MAQVLTEGSTQSASGSASSSKGKILNVVLWVLQIAGAGMFLMVGFLKLSGNAQLVGLFEAIGLGQWFRYLTGTLEVLLIAGVPLYEPVARYGPFVMNTEGEIRQAIEDYQLGRMGAISS